LNRLGLGLGAAGVLSVLPTLSALDVAFGLLEIMWLAWLGSALIRTGARALDHIPQQ